MNIDQFTKHIRDIEAKRDECEKYLKNADKEITEKIIFEMMEQKKRSSKRSGDETYSFYKKTLRLRYGPYKNGPTAHFCSDKLKFLKDYRTNPDKYYSELMTITYD